MKEIITLVLVGLSVGLGNFAASVAIGLGGVSKSLRIRIALIFGLFETGMPIIGLIIGKQVASKLGGHANIIGAGLLVLTGIYLLIGAISNNKSKDKHLSNNWGKLLLAGLSLSIDNLIIGFSLGARHQSLLLSALVIGLSSVTLSLVGLELGNRLNSRVEEYGEFLSATILILVGIAIGFNVL